MSLPVKPLPKQESEIQQAVKDARAILDSHAPIFYMKTEKTMTNEFPIKLGTLELLVQQAERPVDIWGWAHFFFSTSSFFALIAGISLFLLSRKNKSDRTTSA
jgi:hypothetical protein